MENWSNDIQDKINLYRRNEESYRNLKLNLLLRIIKKIDVLSLDCEQCQNFKKDITRLTDKIEIEKKEEYLTLIDRIVKHLKKKHHIKKEEDIISVWAIYGLAVGTTVGELIIERPSFGAVTMALGVLIGFLHSYFAKRKGHLLELSWVEWF
ncbi:MAG: hypothetical protein KAS49_02235 [Candidatus Cloacimonetes bacterium]|nr:hypothetical protein [Candidatus Cloacimonadota bacterium]